MARPAMVGVGVGLTGIGFLTALLRDAGANVDPPAVALM
jgi:hypothetical protein